MRGLEESIMQLKVFKKKFCDSITFNTHKLLLMSPGVMGFWLKGSFHVTSSAWAVFSLTEDHAPDGSLLAWGRQDSGRALGNPLAAFSFHAGLLLAGLELGQKRPANSNLSQVREERDLIRRNKWWLLCVAPTSVLLPSQGELQPGKWIMLNLLQVYLRLRASWIQPPIFCSNIDSVLLSQISYWFLGSPLVSEKRANPSFMFVYIPYLAGARGALFTLICE